MSRGLARRADRAAVAQRAPVCDSLRIERRVVQLLLDHATRAAYARIFLADARSLQAGESRELYRGSEHEAALFGVESMRLAGSAEQRLREEANPHLGRAMYLKIPGRPRMTRSQLTAKSRRSSATGGAERMCQTSTRRNLASQRASSGSRRIRPHHWTTAGTTPHRASSSAERVSRRAETAEILAAVHRRRTMGKEAGRLRHRTLRSPSSPSGMRPRS